MPQTTTAARSAATLTPAELNEAFEALRREVVTGDDAYMAAYLSDLAALASNAYRAHGVFKRWSHRNHLLLESQRRAYAEAHIGLYAGASQWQKMERQVRDDARAKTIWAFAGMRPQDDDQEVQAPRNGAQEAAGPRGGRRQQGGGGMRFIRVPVFDWSDTVSLDPDFVEPTWDTPLAYGDFATLDALAASAALPVRFEDLSARAESSLVVDGEIVVDASLPLGSRIGALARQLTRIHRGHAEMIASATKLQYEYMVATCDQEAALGEWLVLKMLGLDETVGNDLTTAVATYLRTWIDPETGEELAGHKKRLKLLNSRLDAAMGAAKEIISAYMTVTADAVAA